MVVETGATKAISGGGKDVQCLDDCTIEDETLDATALPFTEGALRRNADLPDAWLPGRSFNAVDKLRHLPLEFVGRDQQTGIEGDEQKPVILHLASGEGGTGEEA
jgi:hypothetical protein